PHAEVRLGVDEPPPDVQREVEVGRGVEDAGAAEARDELAAGDAHSWAEVVADAVEVEVARAHLAVFVGDDDGAAGARVDVVVALDALDRAVERREHRLAHGLAHVHAAVSELALRRPRLRPRRAETRGPVRAQPPRPAPRAQPLGP